MNIAVNTRFLLKNKMEGIGWFTYETLKIMVKDHPEDHFHFIFDRPYHDSFLFSDNISPHVLYPPARHSVLWKIWFEYSMPWMLNKIQPDVFYSPDGYNSLRSPWKSVMAIHDLAFEFYPEFISKGVADFYLKNTPLYAKKADAIVAVSNNTKKDIISKYGVLPEKIDVACNGCRDIFKPISEPQKEQVRLKYTSGKPFFIFIGAIHPRKNVEGIIQAFDLLKKTEDIPHKLVLVGRMAWQTDKFQALLTKMQHKEDVVHIPHIGDKIAQLLGSSEGLVYPSFYEGFGIPIVEAFHSEVPVITATNSSLPEVAGDGALLVDAHSVESIMDAMRSLVKDQTMRESLIEHGRTQRQKYSWKKAANVIYSSIKKVAT